MARPLRIKFAGGLYHVTSRGDGREDIYLADGDRKGFLDVSGEACEMFNWSVHAWCQMANDVHLLVETQDGILSKGIRHLNGVEDGGGRTRFLAPVQFFTLDCGGRT